MTPDSQPLRALAHELWAMAQLGRGEGIEDAVSRIAAALRQSVVGDMEAMKSALPNLQFVSGDVFILRNTVDEAAELLRKRPRSNDEGFENACDEWLADFDAE